MNSLQTFLVPALLPLLVAVATYGLVDSDTVLPPVN